MKNPCARTSKQKRGWAFIQDGLICARVRPYIHSLYSYTQILDLNSPVHGHDKAWSAVATLAAIVLSNGCLDRVETSLGTMCVCVCMVGGSQSCMQWSDPIAPTDIPKTHGTQLQTV